MTTALDEGARVPLAPIEEYPLFEWDAYLAEEFDLPVGSGAEDVLGAIRERHWEGDPPMAWKGYWLAHFEQVWNGRELTEDDAVKLHEDFLRKDALRNTITGAGPEQILGDTSAKQVVVDLSAKPWRGRSQRRVSRHTKR